MKPEQFVAMRGLGAKGKAFGDQWDAVFESAFLIRGHDCGGMPLGFRAGLVALKRLGADAS